MNSTPTELWRWSGSQLVDGIRTRKISSREAVESCLARIDKTNPKLNALVEVSPQEALQMAEEADKAVSEGRMLGPLHGVPFSIKCNSDQTGHATTHGIVAFKDNIADADAPHVANLRAAGAVFVGRSNCPAFSYRWITQCDAHGRTSNPWNKDLTPGGSSGGASSAVASGMVPIAHGNDIGGSIREPAFCCGIAGLRPTVGRVAGWFSAPGADQALSVQQMLVQGTLARTIADLRISLRAMAQFDPRDPTFAPVPLDGPPIGRPIKVGLLRDPGVMTPESTINAALDLAASQLKEAGYLVEEIELPILAEAYRLWWLLAMEEFRPLMPAVSEVGGKGMLTAAKYYYGVAAEMWGEKPSLDTYMNGYARRGTIISELATFLLRYPLLLLPISAEHKLEQDADIVSLDRTRKLMAAHWSLMAIPMVGFPAITVPTGVVDDHPIGVQLLASRFREDVLFDAAEVIESCCGIFTPIDPKWG